MKTFLALLAVLAAFPLMAQSLEEGQRALERGQYERALDQLNKYLARSPQDAEARFLKGLAEVMLERDDAAIRTFSDLVRDYPELPEPYNNLAVLYARNGQYEKARDALESALVTHPSYATAHENLGDIYSALANASYNRAKVLDKDNPALATKLEVLGQLSDLKDAAAPASIVAQQRASATPQPTAAPRAAATPQPTATPAPRAAATPQPTASPQVAAATPAPRPTPGPEIAAATPAPTPQPTPAARAATPAPLLRPGTEPQPVLRSGAREASPQPASPTAAASDEVLASVERWRAAWSAQDVQGYLGAYSLNFDPDSGISRSAWEDQRSRRLTRPSSIEVQVLSPEVRFRSGRLAEVEFTQIYESSTYSDQVRKQLELEKTDRGWLIVSERVLQ